VTEGEARDTSEGKTWVGGVGRHQCPGIGTERVPLERR